MKQRKSLAALEASLSRRFRVCETTVAVAGKALSILHPANSDDLISEQDFVRDDRLPYWAELWPSARVLGQWIGQMAGEGRSMLELGCGSGLVSVSGALAGFRVVASDYYEDAVRFARVNAWRNGVAEVAGLTLDWRDVPNDLQRFDVVVASDVLYEQRYGELIAKVIDAALTETGIALIADPGRIARETFLQALAGVRLSTRRRVDVPFEEGEIRQTISVFEIGRP